MVGAAVGAGLALATGGPIQLRGCNVDRSVELSAEPESSAVAAAPESFPADAAVAPPLADSSEPPASSGKQHVDTPSSVGASAAEPGQSRGCPDGMVRVEGKYCPDVAQDCAKFDPFKSNILFFKMW